MRFLLVVAIWIVIVGGLWSYIAQRDAKRQQITVRTPVDTTIEGQFAIEVTPTFTVEEDPFALQTSDAESQVFELKLNGKTIDINAEEVRRGQSIRQENVVGMLAGHNEIYVSASPPISESSLEHGIRVKVYEDATLVVDQTVWASQGALVSGTISFRHSQKEEGSHEH